MTVLVMPLKSVRLRCVLLQVLHWTQVAAGRTAAPLIVDNSSSKNDTKIDPSPEVVTQSCLANSHQESHPAERVAESGVGAVSGLRGRPRARDRDANPDFWTLQGIPGSLGNGHRGGPVLRLSNREL